MSWKNRAFGLMLIAAPMVAAGFWPAASPAQRLPAEVVAAPDRWVAFTADVAVHQPDKPPIHGKYYRNGEGSTRLEAGFQGDSRGPLTTIHNVPRLLVYVGRDGTWSAFSWEHAVLRPLRYKKTMVGLRPYRWKLALSVGETPSLQATKGFDAYELSNGTSTRMLLVPSLNFFHVLRQTIGGRHELYTNIRLGEPSPALFQPGPGETVIPISAPTPGDAVSTSTKQGACTGPRSSPGR